MYNSNLRGIYVSHLNVKRITKVSGYFWTVADVTDSGGTRPTPISGFPRDALGVRALCGKSVRHRSTRVLYYPLLQLYPDGRVCCTRLQCPKRAHEFQRFQVHYRIYVLHCVALDKHDSRVSNCEHPYF